MAEQEQGQSGQDSPKKDMDELIHRVAKLERQTSMGPENGSHGQNGAADGHVSKDLSDLFQLDGDGDGKDDNGKTANSKQTGSSLDLCTNLWGGPIQPRSDQSLWAWMENFFGGVTTAHGINRVFDEDNGILRRLFWFGAFTASFYALFFFVIDSIMLFIEAKSDTSFGQDSHAGILPMMTVCNLSPIRCGCSGFYDPSLVNNQQLFPMILPFICSNAVVYSDANYNADSSSTATMEDSKKYVDVILTAQSMTNFSEKLGCGLDGYTDTWFVNAVQSGILQYHELIKYAGYMDRSKLLRKCMAIDADPTSKTSGKKVSCMDDSWWGPPKIDENYGACHTFNPCQGFPVGDGCTSDADCEHMYDKSLKGGICDPTKKTCQCTLCKSGKDCKIAKQLNPGRGNGIRMVLNVATDQDATLTAASKARWNAGAIVHFHSHYDDGNLGEAYTVPPGKVTNFGIARENFKEQLYPFTNCSKWYNVDPSVCQLNCLRRLDAVRCCKRDVSDVTKGELPVINVSSGGALVNLTNPMLSCNILDPEVVTCFEQQAQRVSDGMDCLDGALGTTSPYYKVWKRTNWYDDSDVTSESMVGKQEKKSQSIKKQCVWTISQGKDNEADYGKECKIDSDCKTSQSGGVNGVCVDASRAYCPQRCEYDQFNVVSQSAADMSVGTIKIIAAQELATVTKAYDPQNPEVRRWKPRCGVYPGVTDCFTDTQAQALVKDSYSLLNIDYLNFDMVVSQKVGSITLATLMGTIGGNLGMFTGISVMTIMEWLELLFFAIVSMPFFFFGIKIGPFIRSAPSQSEDDEDLIDDDVRQVLMNIKKIAAKRKGKDGIPDAVALPIEESASPAVTANLAEYRM
uniref:Uncharacterized protein n=1 Tax=Hanusia phi TaxID=3032 RepID=A0A7S0EM62_9CRYP